MVPRFEQLRKAFKEANIFILPLGSIENYYIRTAVNHYRATGKDVAFHAERDYIIEIEDKAQLQEDYPDLIAILEDSVSPLQISLEKHLRFQLVEWIQNIQRGVAKGEIRDTETAKTNPRSAYEVYSQIFELTELAVEEDGQFAAALTTKPSLSPHNLPTTVRFTHATVPREFDFRFE